MTDTETKMTDTDNMEEQNKQSDARIILGPLVKYAAMGFVLVSIIITTAVMLDSQFNNIDREVVELEAQLAQARMGTVVEADADTAAGPQAEVTTTVEAEAVQPEPAVAEIEKPAATPVVENTVDTAPAVTETAAQVVTNETVATETVATEPSVAEKAVVEDVVADKANRHTDVFDMSIDELIAERNSHLKEMDREYLERFKASQAKQLQFLRERLARQESRIEEMEKRNQEIYDVRAANVKEMQQMRENFHADRI